MLFIYFLYHSVIFYFFCSFPFFSILIFSFLFLFLFFIKTVRNQALEITSKNLEKENLVKGHAESIKHLNEQLEIFKEEISCIVQEKKMLQIAEDSMMEEKNVLQTVVNNAKKEVMEFEILLQQYKNEKDEALATFDTDGARVAQQVSSVEC